MDNDLNSMKEIDKIAEAIQAYRENKEKPCHYSE